MRILIIGSSGMLGSDLVEQWTDDEVIPATSGDVDIRDIGQVRQFITQANPDWVVLAAAYTDVDGSERNPAQAFAVNGEGTRNVARVAQELGRKLFYVSTDYVFDSTSLRPYEPDDPVHPLNVYGASKAAGENAVREESKHWLIARTSWLFGACRASFPERILRVAASQYQIKVVVDQIGSPTITRDLATAIRDLVHSDARGILHITNSGSCSWFEFAKEVLLKAGAQPLFYQSPRLRRIASPNVPPILSSPQPVLLHAGSGLEVGDRLWMAISQIYIRGAKWTGR